MMSSSEIAEKKALCLDDILIKFNLSGRYYMSLIFLIYLLYFNDIVLVCGYVFSAAKVSYRCVDERFGNDSCASLSNSTEVCSEWVYDDPHSFVAEFQLACQEWKRTLVGTIQSFGYGAGLIIIGPLSDRFGRKLMIVLSGVTCALIGVAKSFLTNYWAFICFEFLGSTFGNVYSPTYILVIEVVAHEKRVLITVLCSIASSLAYVYPPLVAWSMPYWRHMLLVLHAPAFIFISYLYLLDESPRWLLSRGRKDEAVAILKKAAKRNKTHLNKDEFDNLICEKNEGLPLRESIRQTIASRHLLKRFLVCWVWWVTSTFLSFGIKVNSVLLPGDKYVNFALLGIISLPARIITFWLLNKFTRKIALISTFLPCALLFLIEPLVPANISWIPIVLYLGGKLFTTIFFAVTYIFTSELFPTTTRNSTHAFCSSLGRIGSILAPQTPLLMAYWDGLPSVTFGSVPLFAAIITLVFAPNTASDVLPDTVRQAESIGQTKPEVGNKSGDNIFTIDSQLKES